LILGIGDAVERLHSALEKGYSERYHLKRSLLDFCWLCERFKSISQPREPSDLR
jgi:hypothetical protein